MAVANQNGIHSSEPTVKYVGQKISKVRWRPQPSGAISSSDVFASGSWDDESANQVCLWEYRRDEQTNEPQLMCEAVVNSDVTDLCFLDERRLVASFSNGCVALFKYQDLQKCLKMAHVWEKLHYLGGELLSPCTALGVCGGMSLVTGGEDGRINVIEVEVHQVTRTIANADNATVTSLTCTLLSEVLSTSSSGQLKVWDLKTAGNKPVKTIVLSGEYVSIQSMDRHPHQPHLIVLGRGDGSLCFWDLRQDRQPVQIIQGHSSDVWEVMFHSSQPNHLFSCSEDGSLWHWDATQNVPSVQRVQPSRPFSPSVTSSRPQSTESFPSHSTPLTRHTHPTHRPSSPHTDHTTSTSVTSPWLSGAVHQGKVDITNYLPDNCLSVNSLDIESNNLVCGSDSEGLFMIPDLVLR